jgi:hypothetical protein
MEVPYKKKTHPNGFLMSTAAVGGGGGSEQTWLPLNHDGQV